MKPAAAAAAPFHKLRGRPVALLVAANVGCFLPPMRESAAGYEPAAGNEPFLPAAAPRRLPERDCSRYLTLFLVLSANLCSAECRLDLAGVLGDMVPKGTQDKASGDSKHLFSSTPLSLGHSNAASLDWCAILLLSPSVQLNERRRSRLKFFEIDAG